MATNQMVWERHKKFDVTEKNVVIRFEMHSSRQLIDITSLGDYSPGTRFIPGALDGWCHFEIYNSDVNWIETLGEETVYVLPDQNDTTVVGVVEKVMHVTHVDKPDTTLVTLRLVQILV